MDKGPAVIVEVSSSKNTKGTKGQSEIEPGSTDQAKQIDYVHHFMNIRKIRENNKHNVIPKIFDLDTSQTIMILVLDYEKLSLNITVMEPKK